MTGFSSITVDGKTDSLTGRWTDMRVNNHIPGDRESLQSTSYRRAATGKRDWRSLYKQTQMRHWASSKRNGYSAESISIAELKEDRESPPKTS